MQFDHSLMIAAAPTRILDAFFDPVALATWWQASRSVTTPRALGVYAIEWPATPDRDDILGRLGGTFYGVVMDHMAGREFFVADAYWLPPDGDPIGPMALNVSCAMDGPACRLRVRQSGFAEGARWARYYAVISAGWRSSLAALKEYVEDA
jgi:uncharacterized protein YndB with AHSA1/START domain